MLDVEKAFDQVKWRFMFDVLEKMGMGGYFVESVKQIYNQQKIRVIVNGEKTANIDVNKGTRQGCPLSPLLFITVLEVLNNSIRENERIRGLKIKGHEIKLKAYADDMALIVEDPTRNLEYVLAEINKFGNLSGFKINKSKTVMLTKNLGKKEEDELVKRSGIQKGKKVRYLGIWLSERNTNLYENNYRTMWQKVSMDLKKWDKLNLSLSGRIAVIKMNILPRLIFLFMNLPIITNNGIFRDWNKELGKFVWRGKKARIKWIILKKESNRGGCSLPDLKLYYHACSLLWLQNWIKLDKTNITDLEAVNLKYGWHAYLEYGMEKTDKEFKNHIIRRSLIQTWKVIKEKFYSGIPLWISIQNAFFSGEVKKDKQLCYKELLIIDPKGEIKIRSRQELETSGKIINWLEYYQIKSKCKEDIKKGEFEIQQNIIDKIIWDNDMGKVSKLYKILIHRELELETVTETMIKWAQEIGHVIPFENWEKAWMQSNKFTCSQDLKENYLKTANRWYYTPLRLSKIYGIQENLCWKCQIKIGSYYHVWWTCKKIKKFWNRIHEEIQKIIDLKFPCTPEFYLLNMTSVLGIEKEKKYWRLVLYLITSARIVLARYWKLKTTPNIEEWLEKIVEVRELDKITVWNRKKSTDYWEREWQPLTMYLNNLGGEKM